jgi:serine/threonine-protein kinase
MADVYEAEHLRLGNRVAVKLLRTTGRGERSSVERFRHEAQRVAALSSDHIVKVFDCGELANGTPFLVMERLLGEDLRSLLEREGKLPVRRAVELAIGACRGLSAAHAAGLVHRDLKPANLFVVRTADALDSCKILDFGVSKALVSDATAGGTLLGTVRYMAPEQLEDAASARATADVYAVGAILYECLTGTPPQTGETLQELMFNILHRPIVPPSDLCSLPEELERVVLKALSRDKAARYQRAELMARALAPFGALRPSQRGTERAGDDTLDEDPERRLQSLTRRRPSVGVLSWIAGVGVVLAGIVVFQDGASSVSKEPEPTPR